MTQNIFSTRTTIAITLTNPEEFTMTLTTVTFMEQILASRHLSRARSTLQNLRRKIPGPPKYSLLSTPAAGISPIFDYRQKVSKLREVCKKTSEKLGKVEKVRSGLRRARYTRHYNTAAKSKLTIRESGQDFWSEIMSTARSEAMWERKMASFYKGIFKLQMQERELVEAVCFRLPSLCPIYCISISGWPIKDFWTQKKTANHFMFSFLACEPRTNCSRARCPG